MKTSICKATPHAPAVRSLTILYGRWVVTNALGSHIGRRREIDRLVCLLDSLQCLSFVKEFGMPRTPKRNPWTAADVKQLRRLAGRKNVKAIGRELKRTEAAVRFKAHTEAISLALK